MGRFETHRDSDPTGAGFTGHAGRMDVLPAAGLATYKRIMAEKIPHKAGIKEFRGGACNLSLLQPGNWEPDYNTRIDPGAFKAAAGGLAKLPEPTDKFYDSEKRPGHTVPQAATDPITHFKHEGVCWNGDWHTSKRSGYTSRAAMQSWTWAQDKRVRDNLNLYEDEENKFQKYALGADGKRQLNMWGVEDLVPGGDKEYIKCERPPRFSHIVFNDRVRMPCSLRPHEKMREVPDYSKSSRIWEVMRPEVPDQRPDRSGHFRKYWKERLERMKETSEPCELSDDDDVMESRTIEEHRGRRRERPSRSLPPEMFRGEQSASDPRSSFKSSAPSDSKAQNLSMAPRSINRQDMLPRSMSAREFIRSSGSQDMRPKSNSNQGSSARRVSDTAPRSMSSRSPSEASLSMTPLSITNAMMAARRDPTPKNSRRGS